jgi:hypothetical protein
MKSGRKHIWNVPHFAILEVELMWLMAIYLLYMLLFPPSSTLGYSKAFIGMCHIYEQAHPVILACKVHFKCGSAINRKCVINMMNFCYQFARVALCFLWRSTIDCLLIALSGIVMPIFVWTRSEATTALTVFHIWYYGGDPCLCTRAESSALVKIFCILHGWGRVFVEPDLFRYYLYSFFLSLLV